MSLVYTAKLQVLKAYPEDKESGIDLFFVIMNQMDEEDFEYEYDQTAEDYIYGDKK